MKTGARQRKKKKQERKKRGETIFTAKSTFFSPDTKSYHKKSTKQNTQNNYNNNKTNKNTNKISQDTHLQRQTHNQWPI